MVAWRHRFSTTLLFSFFKYLRPSLWIWALTFSTLICELTLFQPSSNSKVTLGLEETQDLGHPFYIFSFLGCWTLRREWALQLVSVPGTSQSICFLEMILFRGFWVAHSFPLAWKRWHRLGERGQREGGEAGWGIQKRWMQRTEAHAWGCGTTGGRGPCSPRHGCCLLGLAIVL